MTFNIKVKKTILFSKIQINNKTGIHRNKKINTEKKLTQYNCIKFHLWTIRTVSIDNYEWHNGYESHNSEIPSSKPVSKKDKNLIKNYC